MPYHVHVGSTLNVILLQLTLFRVINEVPSLSQQVAHDNQA